MAYSSQQRMLLEAMGLRLYVPLAAVGPELPAPVLRDDAFWQTRLGQNIRRMAPGHDLTALPVSPTVGKSLAKRMLWQQLRPLLKPE